MNTSLNTDLADSVALVTGGTGVLGRAMAKSLLHHGCRVAIGSRSLDKAQHTASQLGDRCIAAALDVTDRASVEKTIEHVTKQFGPISILINAAGGNRPAATVMKPDDFFDIPAEALRGVTDLNLIGTIIPSQVAGRVMAGAGRGTIINISSMAADRPLTRVLGYAAAKSAVDNFTRWLAVHMARNFSPDIRVNAIAPGFFETEQNKFLLRNEKGELSDRGKTIIEHTPMGRFGQPDDLTGTLLWLVSPMSRFVTGTVIPVDGGFSAFSGV